MESDAASGLFPNFFSEVGSLRQDYWFPVRLSLESMASACGAEVLYSFHGSAVGDVLVASAGGGVCAINFAADRGAAFGLLSRQARGARLREREESLHMRVVSALEDPWVDAEGPLPLRLFGTAFQHSVWEALLRIPLGSVIRYSALAAAVGRPRACRAVGSAVSANPVVPLVPCHRVVAAGGKLGGYYWGARRKLEVLKWDGRLASRRGLWP